MTEVEAQRFKSLSAHILASMARIDRESGYDKPPTTYEDQRIYSRVLWWLETPESIATEEALSETMTQYVEGSLQDADRVKGVFESWIGTKTRRYLDGLVYEDPSPVAQQQEF